MSILSKKFYTKNTAGTTQAHNIYSTAAEASGRGGCFSVKVDSSTTGYVALTTNSSAGLVTSGRCKSSNGTTWYMCSAGVPDYTSHYITWNGTFTVPSGVTKLRLTLVGGGAGGHLPGATPNHASGWSWGGVGGGTTWFGTVQAAGGSDSAGYCSWHIETSEYSSWWESSFTNASQSTGFYNGGVYWNTDPHNGGGSVPLTNYQGTIIGYAGNGGHSDSANVHIPGLPGASGYRTQTIANVTPGQQIGYGIGGAGAANRFGDKRYNANWGSGGAHVSTGSAGAILLEYGRGIE